MPNSPQQRENHTNTLSEQHVQSAVETVLANRPESYDDFMSGFLVLTHDDVAEYASRQSACVNEGETTDVSPEEPRSLFESSPTISAADRPKPPQIEELEIEELGDDFSNDKEPPMGSQARTKHLQVDNYLDGPDSESELISDDDDLLDFDDASSKYVASFDLKQGEGEEGTEKRADAIVVTPEMVEKVEGEEKVNVDDAVNEPEASSYPDLYPGEVAEEEIGAAPLLQPPSEGAHITTLPHGTGTPQPSEGQVEESREEETTHDEVIDFSIDPDFDYDNVTLTPKWQPGQWPPSGT